MQVIGLCRFSYLGQGGFQVKHADMETRAAYLYAPDRMALRFRFFESICLPGIRAQTDPDFTILVVVSDAMPRQYLDHLRELVADVPQIVVEAHPPGRHRVVIHRAIEAQRKHPSEPCLQFRLDDDDGISVRFVERLKTVAEQCQPLLASYRMLAIDFNRGFVIAPDAAGVQVAPVQQQYWANAFALFKRGSARLSVHSFGHRKLWQHMPTVTLPDKHMMLRGLHANNDSRQTKNTDEFGLAPVTDTQIPLLQSAYGIDIGSIHKQFSAAE